MGKHYRRTCCKEKAHRYNDVAFICSYSPSEVRWKKKKTQIGCEEIETFQCTLKNLKMSYVFTPKELSEVGKELYNFLEIGCSLKNKNLSNQLQRFWWHWKNPGQYVSKIDQGGSYYMLDVDAVYAIDKQQQKIVVSCHGYVIEKDSATVTTNSIIYFHTEIIPVTFIRLEKYFPGFVEKAMVAKKMGFSAQDIAHCAKNKENAVTPKKNAMAVKNENLVILPKELATIF